MSKIIVIVGPTGVGKTACSIYLAHKYNAEVINADSTGVYKEPLIATAKVTEEEKDGVIHHMLDLVSLDDDFTLYDYQVKGRKVLDDLISQNKNVIIVGGSGLYIKALLYDYKLDKTDNIRVDYSKYTNQELKNMADKIYKNNNIHVNNRQRLERYITYYKQTGKTIKKTNDINKKLYNFDIIGLKSDKETLYKRMNDRVNIMFKNGLLDEAKKLKDKKNFNNIIGYKELNQYFNGSISLDEAIDLIKQNTRRYSKRQFTWFNNQMKDIKWFDVNYNDFNETIKEIDIYLQEKR
ncbi:MAG: tRNA (adenosine(37)-N6)-dimethylallyltransferase MiaA [Clostridium sp.]|nr:tRNA (adenosine(37)-N6)-dimethylallyltransferase MiaA [Clostridium sp.]